MIGFVAMYFRVSGSVVLATAISGFVFSAIPLPSLAQTKTTAASSTAAHSDYEYEALMADIDSVLGHDSDPAEQESAPAPQPRSPRHRPAPTPTCRLAADGLIR